MSAPRSTPKRAAIRAKALPPTGTGVPSDAIGPGIPLPPTDRTHPPLGIGLWALGRWNHEDEARTKAMIGRALEVGFRWFDTAEIYGTGRSERLLGDLLGRTPTTPPPFVVTKVFSEHLRAGQVKAALIGSLQRLGLASVDLYLVHAPNAHVPIRETMGALEALWKEGKIKAIGVSNFSVEELEAAQAALTETGIVVNQVRYNLFDRVDADPVREYCEQHRILLEAYTPLARGLLAGRFLDGEEVSKPARSASSHIFEGEKLSELLERAKALDALAKQEKVPMTALALHWLRKQGAAPIIGASRPEQVDSILEAWRTVPSDAALARADRIGRGDRD